MKKKLLVILGAGSSLSCGLPSVGEIDEAMREWATEWKPPGGAENYFEILWDNVGRYYEGGPTGLRPQVNFEKVLGEMLALAHWATPAPWGMTLKQTVAPDALLSNIVFPDTGVRAGSELLNDQLASLLVKLAKYMRRRCIEVAEQEGPFIQYQKLFSTLRQQFEIGVYNLNYDNLVLRAMPDAYTGFGNSGSFEPGEVHSRRSWDFIYHLHGSVHHSLNSPKGDKIEWRYDLKNDASFHDGYPGTANDERSDGMSFPITTLVAGGYKLDQILAEPFHSFYARLARDIYEADGVLIGGYGFADIHVNWALGNRFFQKNWPDRPPVAVLDWASGKPDDRYFRSDFWTHRAMRVLSTGPHFLKEFGSPTTAPLSDLVQRRVFEMSEPHKAGFWYNGFTDAAERIEELTAWLGGGEDSLLAGR